MTNSVGAPGTAFQRTLAPTAPKIVACYREAIPRVGPHTSGEGSGVLHVETNDTGMIARAQLDGALHAELGACIARAVIGARVPNVDTGAAHADLPLVYHLR